MKKLQKFQIGEAVKWKFGNMTYYGQIWCKCGKRWWVCVRERDDRPLVVDAYPLLMDEADLTHVSNKRYKSSLPAWAR